MKANNRHVFAKNRPVARTARALVAALACAAIGNAVAADWEVWSEMKNGMTGAQQITNALTKLSSGDTIRVNPGTYDFTGIVMTTYTKNSYTITNHLARNCNYSLVGVTDGHWDDKVVFTGNRRCLDSHYANGMDSCNVTIRNITFEDFNGGECPSGGSYESRGGALRLTDSGTTVDIVSNCVFRNCHAYIGGAVNGGVLTDCILTNNTSTARGGATCSSCLRDCRVMYNSSNGTYGNSGAFYGHKGLYNTLFEGNTCKQSGGAGEHMNNTYLITNCVFRNNKTTTSSTSHGGGAIRVEAINTPNPGDIVDCRFEGNSATASFGGAIYQYSASGTSKYYPARIRNCVFTDNVSSKGGGAIYAGDYLQTVPAVTDCSFSNSVCLAGNGGALYRGACTNCTFVGNRISAQHYGASLCGTRDTSKPYLLTSSAVNCLFKENFRVVNGGTRDQAGYPGGDVCCARMENCEVIDGAGEFNYCSIVNSRFHHMTNSCAMSVFNEENWVTNCLIDHCDMSNRQFAMFFRGNYDPDSGRGRERGAWVNCTFADNILESWRGMIHVQASWITSSGRDPHAAFDFINCIFYNNRKTSETGTLADISGRDAFDVTYSNCVYGAADGTLKYGTTNGWTNVGGTFVCTNPRFAKEQAAKLECTYYTPRATSPVLGKGDASFYTDTDVDLAGKPRLKEGKVDLGAYQSWVKACGFLIIFR